MKITNFPSRQRGSVLITTVVLLTVITLTAGSFVRLAQSEMNLSNRAFYSNAALNLAEGGIEYGMAAFHQFDWSGWQISGSNARRTIDNIQIPGSPAPGRIIVRVTNYSGSSNPKIQAEGAILLAQGPPVRKQLETDLVRRSLFRTGLVARDRVIVSGGNADISSYRSSEGRYGIAPRRDRGSVGSMSVEINPVDLGNSTVFGFVATRGGAPVTGPNGRIHGFDTPTDVKVDPNRVSRDFAAYIGPVDPDVGPASGPFPAKVGNVYTLGSPNSTTPTVYRVANLNIQSSEEVVIAGPVQIVVDNVSVAGQLTVAGTGSMELYITNSASVSGNGLVNQTNTPSKCSIYGISSTTQTFSLGGNGVWQAVVYAPLARIEMKGGGNSGAFAGSVVGYEVKITGNYKFYFDEDLGNYSRYSGFRVEAWREIPANAFLTL
jgi:hypothetical protein